MTNTTGRTLASLQFYISRVRHQVDGVSSRTFPGGHEGPTLWLRLISGLLDTAEDRLKDCISGKGKTDPLDHLSTALLLTVAAYDAMDEIRGSDITSLPFPVVRPMQEWFKAFDLVSTIIFRSENRTNYEIEPVSEGSLLRISHPAKTLSDSISKIDWPVLIVTVPSEAFGVLPHFAVVAHEVGHAIVPKYKSLIWKKIETDIGQTVSELRKEVYRLALKRRRKKVAAQKYPGLIIPSFESWVEEVMADAVCYYLAGPAGFFALCDLLQTGEIWPTETHPPSDIRRKIMFSALCDGAKSFANVFECVAGEKLTESFNSPLMAKLPSPGDLFNGLVQNGRLEIEAAVLTALTELMQSLGPTIFAATMAILRAKKPELQYTTEKFEDDLGRPLESLLAAIPPIETGDKLEDRMAAEFVSILNIGWVVFLTKLQQLPRRAREPKHLRDGAQAEWLHSLLLKAVELSEVKKTWRSV